MISEDVREFLEVVGNVNGDIADYDPADIEKWARQLLDRLAKPYAHRNGETEPPEVEGEFWFEGHFDYVDDSGDDRSAYVAMRGDVSTNHKGVRKIQNNWCNTNAIGCFDVEELRGKWYGPTVAPWEGS